ncbi:MAG: DUF3108 domain-containing protein [Pseudomonadales bacterium]|nr:DUF3108 domain-containing protein [Pseudomonadales bacterium]
MNRLLILPLLTFFSCFVHAIDLQPYRAEYQGKYQGVPVKAKGMRELSRLEDGSYRLTSSASATFMKVKEVTEFNLREGLVVPTAYDYQRKVFGRKKKESVTFDWSAMRASHEGTTSKLAPGTLDKLGYQVQLRMDVAQTLDTDESSQPLLAYTIADEEKRKDYHFVLLGEETLSTPAGELRTVALERYREDKDRRTTVWLALDHQLLLVRLKQEEPDKGFELNLERFEFGSDVEVANN